VLDKRRAEEIALYTKKERGFVYRAAKALRSGKPI
jgi:hypothetical protein